MNPHIRNYWIILVHFGPPEPTNRALRAIAAGSEIPQKVIVINNDKTKYQCQEKIGHLCQVIHSAKNNGYGAALNKGLGALVAHGVQPNDIVICMNNDVELAPPTLQAIKEWWNSYRGEAIAGVSINEQGHDSTVGYVNLWTGRSVLTEVKYQKFWQLQYLHGALFTAPYKTFMALGGIPEDYFLYWEDVALAAHTHRRGIKLEHIQAQPANHWAARQPISQDHLFYLVRNGAHFLECSTPPLWRSYWWVMNRFRLIYHRMRPNKKLVYQALLDGIRHKKGVRAL